MRRERVRDRAEDAARAAREETREIRQLARLEERVDDVERRGVEPYDRQPRSRHLLRSSL
jgi:hypothetical protein